MPGSGQRNGIRCIGSISSISSPHLKALLRVLSVYFAISALELNRRDRRERPQRTPKEIRNFELSLFFSRVCLPEAHLFSPFSYN